MMVLPHLGAGFSAARGLNDTAPRQPQDRINNDDDNNNDDEHVSASCHMFPTLDLLTAHNTMG